MISLCSGRRAPEFRISFRLAPIIYSLIPFVFCLPGFFDGTGEGSGALEPIVFLLPLIKLPVTVQVHVSKIKIKS